MVMWLHGCFLYPLFVNQSACHHTMDDVHIFEGTHYIPIKAIGDKERKWVSGGWLSKWMAHFGYPKKKPTEIGFSVTAGLGRRAGDYMRLERPSAASPIGGALACRGIFF